MTEVISVNGKTGEVVLHAADVEAVPDSSVGVAGGVASLNGSGKLPEGQLPGSVESVSVAPSGGDDTSILQTAINTYSEVRLQRGATYLLKTNTGLKVDPSKCRVRGSATILGCGEMTEGTAVTFSGSTNSFDNAMSGGWEGIKLNGPGSSSSVKGIAFVGESSAKTSSLFSCRDSVVANFGVGISEGSNAWAINLIGLSVYGCGKCVDNSASTANGGERMTYIGCTFFNSTLALNLPYTKGGQHHFIGCSFDFNEQLLVLSGPHKVFLTGCHVEYTAHTKAAYELSGTAPYFVVSDTEWYIHVQTVLTTELAAGVEVTELKVESVEAPITSGDTIKVVTGANVDTFTASANAAFGVTSISVTSHAPTHAHPASTSRVIDYSTLPEYIGKDSAAIESGAGAYFTRVPMEGAITISGNFVEGGTQSQQCFMFPNLADGTCINPSNGNPLNMPSSFPGKSSVIGPLYQNGGAETVSGNHTIKPEIRPFEAMNVTTTSNFTVSMGAGPPVTQTQDMMVVVHNESGGTLGTITWPASWTFAGWTWTNPASGKRRAIRLAYDPNFQKWTVTSISPADY
jgi:hypothetical protein